MKLSAMPLLSILASVLTPHIAAQPLKARQSAVCDAVSVATGHDNAVEIRVASAIKAGETIPGLTLIQSDLAKITQELITVETELGC